LHLLYILFSETYKKKLYSVFFYKNGENIAGKIETTK